MRLKLWLVICLVFLIVGLAEAQRRRNRRPNRPNRPNWPNWPNWPNRPNRPNWPNWPNWPNRPNGNNGNDNQGNGNNGNTTAAITQPDCLAGKRDRLRHAFTDADMNAICERFYKSNREMNEPSQRTLSSSGPSQLRPSDSSEGSMEDKINKILNKPPQPQAARRRPAQNNIRQRKEYRMLTDDERNRFHNAINVLKNFEFGNTNMYDAMANYHQPHLVPGAHWGAGFLGWHKQYLLMMERLMQVIEPNLMIPYWDSTLDSHLGEDAAHSVMWSSLFMGNRFGDVVTGPFAGWTVPRPTQGKYTLWRGNGTTSGMVGRMITDEDVDYLVAINNYRNLTWFVDPYYEMVHGMPHLWIGGHMGTITAAAFDPVFYMHHAFIDHIWDTQRDRVYREIRRRRRDYSYPGLVDDEVYGVGEVQDPFADVPLILDEAQNSAHYPTKQMYPFPLKNSEGLTEEYKTIYNYTNRPTCSRETPDCGSKYLFCIKATYKCAPKLVPGANCTKFTYDEPCYDGHCVSGRCQGISLQDRYLNQFLQYLFGLFQRF